MDELNGKQRRWLRGRAHALRPVVQLGDKGLTEPVLSAVDEALEAHELIKVRLVGEREDRDRLAAELADRTSAEAVGLVGRVAVLYRRHPEPAKRRHHPPR
jgi:RNA-binding protein